MAKRKKLQDKNSPAGQPPSAPPQQQAPTDSSRRLPPWAWIVIFVAGLLLSEYMFYVAGKPLSMILFLVAWVGFWAAQMHRMGWPILKRKPQNKS